MESGPDPETIPMDGDGSGEEDHRPCKQLKRSIEDESTSSVNPPPPVAVAVEDDEDYEAYLADRFPRNWNYLYEGICGSFEDNTTLSPMRFTEEPPDSVYYHTPMDTLQIFSVKVKEIKGGLQWPLHVFGIVAARDFQDHNRNIIFSRSRDHCQTITQENPYLQLTGPSRAIVYLEDPTFEITLKVKGITESEDKDLSHVARSYCDRSMRSYSQVVNSVYTSKLSTVELIFGHIVDSVEATISVTIHRGSWPDGIRGALFTAHTASIEEMRVVLVASEDFSVDAADNKKIVLTRRVASVELEGELNVSVMAASDREKVTYSDRKVFKPMKCGKSHGYLEIGSCEIQVTVAWSTFTIMPLVRGERPGAAASARSSAPYSEDEPLLSIFD